MCWKQQMSLTILWTSLKLKCLILLPCARLCLSTQDIKEGIFFEFQRIQLDLPCMVHCLILGNISVEIGLIWLSPLLNLLLSLQNPLTQTVCGKFDPWLLLLMRRWRPSLFQVDRSVWMSLWWCGSVNGLLVGCLFRGNLILLEMNIIQLVVGRLKWYSFLKLWKESPILLKWACPSFNLHLVLERKLLV